MRIKHNVCLGDAEKWLIHSDCPRKRWPFNGPPHHRQTLSGIITMGHTGVSERWLRQVSFHNCLKDLCDPFSPTVLIILTFIGLANVLKHSQLLSGVIDSPATSIYECSNHNRLPSSNFIYNIMNSINIRILSILTTTFTIWLQQLHFRLKGISTGQSTWKRGGVCWTKWMLPCTTFPVTLKKEGRSLHFARFEKKKTSDNKLH